MKKYTKNIRLTKTTNGGMIAGHHDFVLETYDPIKNEAVKLLVSNFLKEHKDAEYSTQNVISYLLEYTGGKAESVNFVPAVEMVV